MLPVFTINMFSESKFGFSYVWTLGTGKAGRFVVLYVSLNEFISYLEVHILLFLFSLLQFNV